MSEQAESETKKSLGIAKSSMKIQTCEIISKQRSCFFESLCLSIRPTVRPYVGCMLALRPNSEIQICTDTRISYIKSVALHENKYLVSNMAFNSAIQL